MQVLTADEQKLIVALWVGLCDAYPHRSLAVVAAPIEPAPAGEGFMDIVVTDRGRVVRESVARSVITGANREELRNSLIRALRGQLDDPTAVYPPNVEDARTMDQSGLSVYREAGSVLRSHTVAPVSRTEELDIGDSRVLVVDDEESIVELLTDALHSLGAQVLASSNALQALGLLDQEPNLALIDINLGSINGFQLLEQLRRRSSIPVIMITSRIAEEDLVRALSLGADDFVRKPFSIPELMARVERRLRAA